MCAPAAFALWLGVRAALAQVPTGAALAPAAASAGPLRVWIDARGAELDQGKLRSALSQQLGREVVISSDAAEAAVQIRVDGASRASVHFTTASGEELTRSVDLPPDRQRSVEVLSWLTVNLVRDEASELLDELRARRKAEAAARAAEELAQNERAAAEKAAADKAAADKAAAEEAARKQAEQAKLDANGAGGPPTKKPNDDLLRDPLRSIDVAFATPLSLLHDSARRELKLQLALVYGDAGGLRGVALGPGVFRIRHDLDGIASGVAAVLVGGNAKGIVTSVGFADVAGNLEGIAIGVGAALQRGQRARGFVIAAGGALAGDLEGAVIGAGFATSRSLQGAGISAGVTAIRGPSRGALLAGGATVTGDHRGVAVAGGANVGRDLTGFELAPVNVQRRVKGVQLGVINVADEVDGAAIGVLSLAKNGRVQPTVWVQNDGSLHVAIKSIAGLAFTQFGAGIDLSENTFGYDGGIGLHLKLGETFFVEPGVHYSGIHDTDGVLQEHQLHYLGMAGARVGDKLDFLVGGGLRHTFQGGSGAALAPEGRAGIAFF